jgi:putative sigma-54 modulation protein
MVGLSTMGLGEGARMATITITGRDAQVSSRNKEHAEEKLSRLAKYFNGIGKIEAVLGHSGDEAEVEVVISIPRGGPIVCRSTARDLYAAIDLVLDKAEAQLTKHKERRKERHSPKGESAAGERTGAPSEQAEGARDEDQLESYDDVIDKRDF